MEDATCKSMAILYLSLPLAVLVIYASITGLFTNDFYATETLNWQVQSLGQDAINLYLVSPVLILSASFAVTNNKFALQLWSGVILYLIYTYAIYCFDIHFNSMFMIYCVILGLSFYSFLYFVSLYRFQQLDNMLHKRPIVNIVAIYFIVVSCLFYLIWLAEILPALVKQQAPASLAVIGLFTNPVHVIDLSIVLPGIFLTGIFLLRKKFAGLLFAPTILVFFILMDITIGWLVIVINSKGLGDSYALSITMAIVTLVSVFFLVSYVTGKKIRVEKTIIH